MVMMIENPEAEKIPDPLDHTDIDAEIMLKELVEELKDGQILSISMKGVMLSDGKKT